jgi:multidrug resistance efflux pump
MPSSVPDLRSALAALLLAGCGASEAASPKPHWLATAQGRIDALSETRWLAAEVDARIAEVPVREGDTVARGQLLVRLACADRAARAMAAAADADAAAAESRLVAAGPRAEVRDEAAARLAAATADLADARDQLARASALVEQGWVARRRLEQLQQAVAAAEGQRAAAAAALAALANGARADERVAAAARARAAQAGAREAAATAQRCEVRAPIAGQLLRVLRREGEFSGAGSASPLLALADTSQLIVRAEVLDRDAALVRPGMAARVWLDEGGGSWPAHVVASAGLVGRRTARSLDPADRFDRDVREVRLAFDGPAPPAVIGLRVNVGFAAP